MSSPRSALQLLCFDQAQMADRFFRAPEISRAKMNTSMSLALDANVCNSIGQSACQSSKDNVGELLQTWSALSTTLASSDVTLISIAVDICNNLSKRNSFDALEVFLDRLPKISEYTNNQQILRSKIALALKRQQTKVVQDIIKNNNFENGEDLIKAWDESHYMEEEARLQKPLTPLARFRVRKRNPPPKTICPSGMRKMASLPKGATRILKQWLLDHYNDPYPNGEEKIALAKFSGLTSNQVKTWFANARRRIHKGESFQSPKPGLDAFDAKDTSTVKSHLMTRNGLNESFSDVSFPSDPNSLVTPYFSQRVDLFGNGSGHDRMSGHSYRCIHSMYNTHACFSCKDVFDDGNNCIVDFAANDPRCFQHNMNIATPVPVHPNPACSFTRWSHRSPFQCRQDEFDAWYRNISFQTEMHPHVPNFGIESQCERPCLMENSGQSLGLNPCFQASSGLQEKADNIHMDPDKDSLTEVGAARILADLSTKQNLTVQLGQADTILANASV